MSRQVIRLLGALLVSATVLTSQSAWADKLKDVIARGYRRDNEYDATLWL
jgi:hypothetical protein